MTKHTPGPWKVTHLWIGTEDGETIGYASEHRNSHRRPEGENEANARLIAAAPDLLAALEALWDACYAADEDLPEQIDGSLLDAAGRAIAKAKGGPQ